MKKLFVLALILLVAAPLMAQPKDIPIGKDGWMAGITGNMPVASIYPDGKGASVGLAIGAGVAAKIYLQSKDDGSEIFAVLFPLVMMTPRGNTLTDGYPEYGLTIGGEVRFLKAFGLGAAWEFGHDDIEGRMIGLLSIDPSKLLASK